MNHAKKKSIRQLGDRKMFRTSRPEFSAVLTQLCDHLRLNGCVESTLIAYSRAVCDLMEGIGKVPLDCTEQEIITHLSKLRDERGLSSSALNSRICAIRYYSRAVLHRLDIIVDLPNPRRAKLVGDILNSSELKELMSGVRSIKHLSLLHLLFDTGLRAWGIAGLRLGDFDAKAGTLTVRFGKGGKHRVVPYGQQTRETLRHTFAVHYLNNGGSLLRLQQLLGYAHVSTTMIYLKYASVFIPAGLTPLFRRFDPHVDNYGII